MLDGARERMFARGHAGQILELQEVTNEIDASATEEQQLDQLVTLAEQVRPTLERILSSLDTKLATCSKVSIKERSTAVEKLHRPGMQRKRPWYSAAHLSDMLRGQTTVTDLKLLSVIIQNLLESDVQVLCIDASRLLYPTSFGYRFVSVTLKIESILVDFQVLVDEVDAVNDAGHDLYERWRAVDLAQLSTEVAEERDAAQLASFTLYTEAWKQYLERTSQTEVDVNNMLNQMWAVMDAFECKT